MPRTEVCLSILSFSFTCVSRLLTLTWCTYLSSYSAHVQCINIIIYFFWLLVCHAGSRRIQLAILADQEPKRKHYCHTAYTHSNFFLTHWSLPALIFYLFFHHNSLCMYSYSPQIQWPCQGWQKEGAGRNGRYVLVSIKWDQCVHEVVVILSVYILSIWCSTY